MHAIALLPLLLSRPALATEPPPVSTLAPVVVSGSLQPYMLGDEIGNEEIRKTPGATLGNVLQRIDGIHSSTFGGGASQPVIRGQSGPRVPVLESGTELMDASSVSPDHVVDIEPDLAKRIEILRGPRALRFEAATSGAVVNVEDERIPTVVPPSGFEGAVDLNVGTGARQRTGAVSLTTGAGNLAVHVEGLRRLADDYRIPDSDSRRLKGSFNQTSLGSVGLSWIGERGYIGLAYTRQHRTYGLPGHSPEYEDCHPDGGHLHCGGHAEHNDHGHEDALDLEHPVPYVDMRSHRWDLRGEYQAPLPGFSRVRLQASSTRYGHQEIEGDTETSAFRNNGYNTRVELEHEPVHGWYGVFGISASRSDFSTQGAETLMPHTISQRHALFVNEWRDWDDWSIDAAVRHEWLRRSPDGAADFRDSATSASVAASWRYRQGHAVTLTASRIQRMPSAQELFSDGIHLATNTYEIGNANLGKETSHQLELALERTAGDTQWRAALYHHRVQGYIYARTLDRHEDFRLIDYAQHDADFTGVEGRITHRLSPAFSVTGFGDYVRGRLRGDGENLPRIPGARLGASLEAVWGDWRVELEYYRILRQSRVAHHESTTPGYNMLGAYVAYRPSMVAYAPEFWLRADNLLDATAYSHASFLGSLAPLPGRSVTLGMRLTF